MIATIRHQRGFTLVELLIVMAISSVVLLGIVQVFRAQQIAHATNSQSVDMQQNIRSALYMMESEIRMAGYSPGSNAPAGIDTAGRFLVGFTWDSNNDSDVLDQDENITYGFGPTADGNSDGQADAGAGPLGRDPADGGGFRAIANDIQAIAFAYAYDDDLDGQLDEDGGGVIWAYDSNPADVTDNLDTKIDGTALGTGVPYSRIRSVRVWILARAHQGLANYEDNRTYDIGGQNIAGGGDNYMRRRLMSTVKCRNMGLRAETATGS